MKASPKNMPVIILAAGRGSRLGGLTTAMPKCLLDVAGMSLLERQVAAVASMPSLSPIVVVTGFAHEKVMSLMGARVVECFNGDWDQANNIVSLAVAAEAGWLDGGFLLFNSDVVFDLRILKGLTEFDKPCALVVDDVGELGEEQMKVVVDGSGRLVQIAKTLDPTASTGEYIGLAKFDADGAQALKVSLRKLIEQNRTRDWYEAAFQDLFAKVDVYPCSTRGYRWTEVDTPEDLQQARSLF